MQGNAAGGQGQGGTHAASAAPIAGAERIEVLDGLRGLALLGVFTANMVTFSGWWFVPPERATALAGGALARDLTMLAFSWLIDGKFYTIFSLLFGIGFALQIGRLEARGDQAAARFRRRLAGLLLIGLCHLLFVWFGDILTLYALCGFALLAVRRWSDRALLRLATALILWPIAGGALLHLLGVPPGFGLFAVSDRVAAATGHSTAAMLPWQVESGWRPFADWQASAFFFRVGSLLESWRAAKVFGIMSIGLWCGRRIADGTLFSDRARLKRVVRWGIALGLPFNFLMAAAGGIDQPYSWAAALAEIGYALGVVPLALAYAALFALAWPRWQRVLRAFVPVGRMALTNYLSQSLIGVAIFQGMGLARAGTMGPLAFWSLALMIYAGQALASRWWLAHVGQGPMERLWRRMTYGGAATQVKAAASG